MQALRWAVVGFVMAFPAAVRAQGSAEFVGTWALKAVLEEVDGKKVWLEQAPAAGSTTITFLVDGSGSMDYVAPDRSAMTRRSKKGKLQNRSLKLAWKFAGDSIDVHWVADTTWTRRVRDASADSMVVDTTGKHDKIPVYLKYTLKNNELTLGDWRLARAK